MTRQTSWIATAFAAALLLATSSVGFAGGLAPRDRPLESSDLAQRDALVKKLNAQGVSQVVLTPEQHGWQGHGIRNGKRVKIEINDNGQWEVKESRH